MQKKTDVISIIFFLISNFNRDLSKLHVFDIYTLKQEIFKLR